MSFLREYFLKQGCCHQAEKVDDMGHSLRDGEDTPVQATPG